ncbi:MAG TPA: alpha/beta hydrolase family protein [Planctomycetota bacterium]|nr:alpha/beta hydrolase family protein [Planctomycetota bacterium]
MAVCTMSFWSPALQKECAMNLILPDRVKTRRKLCVLVQLHGLSDDHTAWMRRTSIDRYVSELPLVVVMPDGGRSFYCDAPDGPACETFLMKDVLGFVERFFPVRTDRRGRAIGGLSMGGYGAMKLALKYPDRFASVVSHSSAFDFGHSEMRLERPEFARILGGAASGGKDDLFAVAEGLDRRRAPAIRFDCGRDDGLIGSNRRFHKHLMKLKIAHRYREYPGAHNWAYWDEHIQEALRFHAKHLKL